MKRKGERKLIEVGKGISFIHLNVASGYISYIDNSGKDAIPRVKGIILEENKEIGTGK